MIQQLKEMTVVVKVKRRSVPVNIAMKKCRKVMRRVSIWQETALSQDTGLMVKRQWNRAIMNKPNRIPIRAGAFE